MMRNNKFYKILRITFLILAIISMTFTLFYKVGHCASGGGSGVDPSQYYLIDDFAPVGSGYGNNLSQSDIDAIVASCDSSKPNDSDIPFIDTYLIVEYNSLSNSLTLAGFCTQGRGIYSTSGSFPDTITATWYSTKTSWSGYGLFTVDLSTNSATFTSWRNSMYTSNIYTWFTQLPNNNYYLEKGIFRSGYPIKCPDSSYNGDIIFKNVASSGGGHSKGGAIADIDESIEDSSELPQVDDTPPSDPSSTPGWLAKILSAFKTLNKNLLGVGVSIVNALQGILDKLGILDIFKNFYEDYNNIRNTNSSDVTSAFQQTILYQGYSYITSDVNSFKNMFNVTPASSAPTWTIPLTGTVLYNQNYPNIVIDFGFYDRFRNTVSNILIAILTCSCVFNIIRSIPDIITGASGDESS